MSRRPRLRPRRRQLCRSGESIISSLGRVTLFYVSKTLVPSVTIYARTFTHLETIPYAASGPRWENGARLIFRDAEFCVGGFSILTLQFNSIFLSRCAMMREKRLSKLAKK